MTEDAGTCKEAIYDLYDRHLEAVRTSDLGALLNMYAPAGEYRLGSPGENATWSVPAPLISHLVAKVARVSGPLRTGLDVYAVSLRGDEAVALVEEWIDDVERGTRDTRLALEVLVRFEAGSWRIARSDSEEASSTLA